MKIKSKLIVISLLIGFVNFGIAQKEFLQEELVGFACFFSGMPSDPVLKITEKLHQEQYSVIAKMLSSENSAEQYMAVITLEKLDQLNMYNLTEIDKSEIKKIKQSTKLVSVCSGCTYMDTLELREMFTSKMQDFAENWMDNHF